MKRTILVLCIGLSLFLNYSRDMSAAEEILLTTQEWPPYQTYENESLSGIAVQVVQCALEKMKQPYTIKVYPWKRAQVMVERGKAQGFFSASQNEARDRYAVLSETIAEQNWNWYMLKDNSLDPEHESFKKNAEVTATFGSNMLSWLEKNDYTIIGHADTTESLLRSVLKGIHDAVLANELVAQEALKQLNESPDTFKIVLNRSKPLGVYWAKTFLEEHPQFLESFNNSVGECRQ
jgi:polar amino acid transport system substrate-binding protein